MASFTKRGGRWRAEAWHNGQRHTKSHRTKAEAKQWALEIETGNSTTGSRQLFTDVLDRYAKEVSPHKKGARWEILRIGTFKKDRIAKMRIGDIDQPAIAQFRDRRLKVVSNSTVNRELNILSAIFTHARQEWLLVSDNPVHGLRRPKQPPPRDRRISEDEIKLVLASLDYQEPPETTSHYIGLAFLLALETAMRQGEIIGLRRSDVHPKHVTLRDTKNGTSRDVPLTSEARRLIELAPNDPLFPMTPGTASTMFRKAVKRTGIENLTFHDTRHEALTRLAQKIELLDLARMVGHRDPRSLMIYYNPKASEIADRLG